MMGGWAVAKTDVIERNSLFSPVAFNVLTIPSKNRKTQWENV
jgi:hypothetical protein